VAPIQDVRWLAANDMFLYHSPVLLESSGAVKEHMLCFINNSPLHTPDSTRFATDEESCTRQISVNLQFANKCEVAQ